MKELLKRLDDASEDHRMINDALNKIQATVATVNEKQREYEHGERMIEIFKTVVAEPQYEILSPSRRVSSYFKIFYKVI